MRALQFRRQELRYAAAAVGSVHADGEGPAVLVDEGLQRLDRHHVMVLEDRVQADDGQLGRREGLAHPLGLRQAMGHTGRAQHLEGVQQHHAAT